MCLCCAGNNNEEKKYQPQRIKIVKGVKEDEMLVLSSIGEALQVNKRGKYFYKTLRDIVERSYRCTFHIKYKSQFTDSKNQVIHKLQEVFPKQWLMRYVRLTIVEKNNLKGIITKYVFV